jgi:hypothetical protein
VTPSSSWSRRRRRRSKWSGWPRGFGARSTAGRSAASRPRPEPSRCLPNFDPADHDHAFSRQWHEQDRVQPIQTHDDPLLLEDDEPRLIEPLPEAVRFPKRSKAGAA